MTRDNQAELILEAFSVFQHLPVEVLAALKQIAMLYCLSAGEALFNQGDLATSFYVVQSGGVRLVENTNDGKVVSLKVYGPGDLFGLLAISGAFPHHAGVEAIETSHVIGFRGEDARLLMQQYPSLALMIIDLLVEHVHHSHARIRQMAAERVERRLARALLHFCEKFGCQQNGTMSIGIALSQQDFAEFTGTTNETVNRIFRMWEKNGFLSYTRREILILDPAALHELADDAVIMNMGYLVNQ